MGAVDSGEAEVSEELLCEHVHLENKVHVQVAKLAPMHIVDFWGSPGGRCCVSCLPEMASCMQGHPIPRNRCVAEEILG